MPIEKMPVTGSIRRWKYREPREVGDAIIEIESSVAKDGDVILRIAGDHSGVAWVRKDELEEFIEALREASKTPCDACGGEGLR